MYLCNTILADEEISDKFDWQCQSKNLNGGGVGGKTNFYQQNKGQHSFSFSY